jgi:DNA-binding CsgD family transcriptional regulator
MKIGNYDLAGQRTCDDARERLKLSHREFQMLYLIAQGLTGREIAAELGVSESTADTFRRRSFQKLGVNSACEAIAIVSAYIAGCDLKRTKVAA